MTRDRDTLSSTHVFRLNKLQKIVLSLSLFPGRLLVCLLYSAIHANIVAIHHHPSSCFNACMARCFIWTRVVVPWLILAYTEGLLMLARALCMANIMDSMSLLYCTMMKVRGPVTD